MKQTLVSSSIVKFFKIVKNTIFSFFLKTSILIASKSVWQRNSGNFQANIKAMPFFLRNFPTALAMGLLCLSMVGCQSLQPKISGELAMNNQDFVGLWDAYNDCQTASNPQAMQANLKILQSAPKPISLDDSPIPIPKFIKQLSSTRNSRLAVDPRAMAASCSIHLAETTRQAADWETSLHTYRSIVEDFPEPQYAFYVSEATRAIEKFSSVRPVSLSSRDSLVR
jgi:hypothetical protein